MTPKQLLINFLWAFLCGILTAYLAKDRGKSPSRWFCIGMFFGIFGLLALFLFPKEESKPLGEEITVLPIIEPDRPELATQWFYLDEMHVQKGPIALSELKELYKNKVISDKSYVWSEGMQQWKTIAALPLLLTHVQTL